LKLLNEIKDYIDTGKPFDENLAIEIANFQIKNCEIYKIFAEKKGIKKIKSIIDIPFIPVEFFKNHKIFSLGKPDNFFISSGTTGNRSKVYYNKEALELYQLSAIKNFPFKNNKIYSLIPPFKIATNSSLSYMIHLFSKEFELLYLNKNSFDIKPDKILEKIIRETDDNSIIFLTAIQLLKIIETSKNRINKQLIFIETGGYKSTGKIYKRRELYNEGKKIFTNSEFYSEYGMAELFSQFWTISENNNYTFSNHNPIFSEEGKNLFKVFDFANLGTISAILVPDLIDKNGEEFDIIGRINSEIRGCGYVFR
jgi:hypothetical protein